jgi:glycosyltransferase involved in cell wall biosynthesis
MNDASAEAAPSLSVVIPTRRRPASLLRALRALARQDLPAEAFEVIVSVDGVDDATRDAVASFRAPYVLRSVDGPGRGRAAACNAALGHARNDVVLILDDDMEPAPACLRRHLRHHADGTRVCVLGAVPVRIDGDTSRAGRFISWKFDLHLRRLSDPRHVFALRDFYSGNTSIRRDVLVDVGLFDEAFKRYGNEDVELSLRLRERGVALLYDGEAVSEQHYEKNLAALSRDTFDKGTTAVLLARAHPGTFSELQLANYRVHHRVAWRALRAALLSLTRAHGGVAAALLRIAQVVERTPFARPLFYVLLLDYFYWLGVDSVLAQGETEPGPLTELAADLRYGPIRLLLHR